MSEHRFWFNYTPPGVTPPGILDYLIAMFLGLLVFVAGGLTVHGIFNLVRWVWDAAAGP